MTTTQNGDDFESPAYSSLGVIGNAALVAANAFAAGAGLHASGSAGWIATACAVVGLLMFLYATSYSE